MKKIIREFFFLRRGERRALLAVSFLLGCSIVFRIGVVLIPSAEVALDSVFIDKMVLIQEELNKKNEVNQNAFANHPSFEKTGKEIIPFLFDPNSISLDSLLQMNISEYVARNIISYREAGGTFSKCEDLQKIYGMDQRIYSALAPFMRISIPDPIHLEIALNDVDSILYFELNGADSVKLMSIPGIGPSYSKRIIKYRSLLGGYMHHGQLWEVYGMDSVRYKALISHTLIDTNGIKLIPLNSATFKELIAHPYINKAETYAILQYRDYVDSIKSIDELKSNQIIDHDRFNELRPYLTLNLYK